MTILAVLAYVLPILATWRCYAQFQYPERTVAMKFLVGHSLAAIAMSLTRPYGLDGVVARVSAEGLFAAYIVSTVFVSQKDLNTRLVLNTGLRQQMSDPKSHSADRSDPDYSYVSGRTGFIVVQVVTLALHLSLLWNSVIGHRIFR